MPSKPKPSKSKKTKTPAKGTPKTFVLDTNVLLHDPRAIFGFGDNDVVIPIYVVEEIDSFKKDASELGRNAREISRHLDELRTAGSLAVGVPLPGGGKLTVATTHLELPEEVTTDRGQDSRIMAVALDLSQRPGFRVVFITKDTNLRIRADAVGIYTEDFEPEQVVAIDDLYHGWRELEANEEVVQQFYTMGFADLPGTYGPNEYICLKAVGNPGYAAIGRVKVTEKGFQLVPLTAAGAAVWGLKPKNREQSFALDALMDDNIKLVTLVGKAGCGKTLMAIAAGLAKVTDTHTFQKLLVSRPVFPLGRDIGYLPGTVEEKLNPWMQPIFDNVEFLMGLTAKEKKRGRSYKELVDLGIVQIEPLTYIRGRSIPQQYMIVDEAQNLTPHEVKTIISRAGEGTKIILTGDPYQIDNPYVDQTNNGLVHVVNRFRHDAIAAHIMLTKGERSQLAEVATRLL